MMPITSDRVNLGELELVNKFFRQVNIWWTTKRIWFLIKKVLKSEKWNELNKLNKTKNPAQNELDFC